MNRQSDIDWMPMTMSRIIMKVRTASASALLMVALTICGITAKPTLKVSASDSFFALEAIVPKKFGDWREERQPVTQVVNPQTKELLDRIYKETLSRTYMNSDGYRIMLSLAYGDDQRGGLQAHKPEVCYPAQGFTVLTNSEVDIATPFGYIAARRLSTSFGKRKEPVTYWFTVGGTTVRGKLQQRLAEIQMGLTGQVPDGLLFRVSSLDDSSHNAFEVQDAFISDLMKVLAPRDREKLGGLLTAH